MAPNFSKNAILTGILDYYCLVCEYHFQSEDDIVLHIAKLTHKENLENTCYDIEDERIRKIKQWYFCEFCNDLIKTKAKIRLHIAEDLHLINKFRQSLLRCDYGILAYGVIAISNSAWSGLCGGTCLICNCEYTDEKQHIDESMHSINLIKNNIKCDAQDNIYRLIDATSFQCLTCNSLESITTINSHFTHDSHKKLSENCRQTAKSLKTMAITKMLPANTELNTNNSTENIDLNANGSTTNIEVNAKGSIDNIELNENNSAENDELYAKDSTENIELNEKDSNVDVDSADTIQKERGRLSKAEIVAKDASPQKPAENTSSVTLKQKKKENSPSQDDLEKFAKDNKLKYKPGGKDVFCEKCRTRVPLNLNNMREHINGNAHKSRNESIKKMNTKVETVEIIEFIKDITEVKTDRNVEFIINGELCITLCSMLLIKRCENSYSHQCLICREILNGSSPFVNVNFLTDHTQKHTLIMEKIPVVRSIPSEFIRVLEARNCYHCGYCNDLYSRDKLDEHLQSNGHKENKNYAKYRLEQYLPDIILNQRRQVQERFFLNVLFEHIIHNMSNQH
ncbi:unnamed protein product [Colias eurytheme]|nr:unnamed protein product [Colias eurytheme]